MAMTYVYLKCHYDHFIDILLYKDLKKKVPLYKNQIKTAYSHTYWQQAVLRFFVFLIHTPLSAEDIVNALYKEFAPSTALLPSYTFQ